MLYLRHIMKRTQDLTEAAVVAAQQSTSASTRKLGKVFGLSHVTIADILKRHGVALRQGRPPKPKTTQPTKTYSPEEVEANRRALLTKKG